jgi:hypothetical protein
VDEFCLRRFGFGKTLFLGIAQLRCGNASASRATLLPFFMDATTLLSVEALNALAAFPDV